MNFGTCDFETYDWTKPLCAAIAYGETRDALNTETFHVDTHTNLEDSVIAAMLYRARTHNVHEWWGHNAGKFDWLLCIDALMRCKGVQCEAHVAAGRIVSLKIEERDGNYITLKDSYAVVQSSLEKAIKDFEIPTQKTFTKKDYKKDMRLMPRQQLLDGCLADVIALWELLERVGEMFEAWGGKLKSTFSSSSLSVLRSKTALPTHKGKQWANAVCREAFHGGRVEVFTHAPATVLQEYDINSSYPASMTQRLPTALLGRAKDPTRAYDADGCGIYQASVTVPHYIHIPVLPYKPSTGGMYFPTGQWTGWFTLPELKYAQQKGTIVNHIHDAVLYEAGYPFKDFVEELYEVKAESVGAKRNFVKLVLNGCYGKFAQRPEKEVIRFFQDIDDAIAFVIKHNGKCRPMGNWNVVAVDQFMWPKQTHYALASYVTAYSRIRLHELLVRAPELAYCDTDSVHCALGNELNSFCGDGLGQLKLEIGFMYATYYAPKLYHLRYMKKGEHADHYASKGFPVSAEAFKEIVAGRSVKTTRMQLLKTQLKKGALPAMLEVEKKWNGRSNKRRILSGYTGSTHPWRVSELLAGEHMKQEPRQW